MSPAYGWRRGNATEGRGKALSSVGTPKPGYRGRALSAAALLLLCSATTLAQQAAEPSLWDDPERFRALAERSEPWPLRDRLPQPVPDMYVMPRPGCEPGEGLPVVVHQPVLEHGRPPAAHETRLRLPGFTYVIAPFPRRPGDGNRLQQRLRAMPEAAFCRGPAPADWADSPWIESAFLEFNLLVGHALDPRCHRPGLPGDPRPECDRPHDSRWWKAFALGLPVDMEINGPVRREPEGVPPGRMAAVWVLPGRTLERRPAGGWTLRDAEGRARAVVLPRLGGDGDTREPLMPDCLVPGTAIGGGWRPPGTPEEEAARPRAWTLCEVTYRHRGLLTVRYRFLREVFDEPDIPALDLRVRRLVQRMLDGADALPSSTDPR